MTKTIHYRMSSFKHWFFLTVLSCFVVIASFGQIDDSISQKKLDLQVSDVYIVKLTIDTLLIQGKLCCQEQQRTQSYNLYKISIKKVLFMADTSVYPDQNALKRVKYLAVNSKINVSRSISNFVSLYNSNTSKILIFGRDLDIEEGKNYTFIYHAYLKGLLKCKKNDFKKFIDKYEY